MLTPEMIKHIIDMQCIWARAYHKNRASYKLQKGREEKKRVKILKSMKRENLI